MLHDFSLIHRGLWFLKFNYLSDMASEIIVFCLQILVCPIIYFENT